MASLSKHEQPIPCLSACHIPKFVHHLVCLNEHKFFSSLLFLEETFLSEIKQVISGGLVDNAMRIPMSVEGVGLMRMLNGMSEQTPLAQV